MAFSAGGYTGPKELHYLFIDGEQLRCAAKEVGMDWFGKPIDIDYRALQGHCQKAFYYDCLPARAAGADEAEHTAKVDAKLSFFNQLRSLPGWHVSEGIARHRKKSRQEQKEVDILIAVDMLTHTHRKNMHRLTFVSGDQDFAPLLEAVVRDGMYVELLYPEGHTSQDLIHFADHAKPMDVDFMYLVSTEDFKRDNGLPTRSGDSTDAPADSEWIGVGLNAGVVFAKVWRENTGGLINIKAARPSYNFNHNYPTVRDRDEARAKRYFTTWMERDFGLPVGSLEWKERP